MHASRANQVTTAAKEAGRGDEVVGQERNSTVNRSGLQEEPICATSPPCSAGEGKTKFQGEESHRPPTFLSAAKLAAIRERMEDCERDPKKLVDWKLYVAHELGLLR
jgi:hypothetical protein